MTNELLALCDKLIRNPNGYNEDSVSIARALKSRLEAEALATLPAPVPTTATKEDMLARIVELEEANQSLADALREARAPAAVLTEERPADVLSAHQCRYMKLLYKGQVMSMSERLWIETIDFLQGELDRLSPSSRAQAGDQA
jgi:hypothetical protein